MNAANLIADNINITSFNGKFEMKNITLTNKAYLQIDKGNTVFQSSQSFHLSWKHAFPGYCLAAPFFGSDYTHQGCKMRKQIIVWYYKLRIILIIIK